MVTVGDMRAIARDGSHELEISRSRFRCSLARAATPEEAGAFIAQIRKSHWSATHNCSAYRVGSSAEHQRSNDDGEPAGTAGVPMLEVLVRRDITDTVAVVTRYFGGIKLGTGGLVRAYGRAVAEALDQVGTVRRVPHREMRITVDHADAGRLDHDLRGAGHLITDVRYDSRAHLLLRLPVEDTATFTQWLAEHTGGRADLRLGETTLLDVPDTPAGR